MYWFTPHPSTKYAVLTHSTDYAVAAVHAVNAESGLVYLSLQAPMGTAHGYRPPVVMPVDRLLMLCQTTEAAWKFKKQIEAQDREAPI